MKAVLLCAGEGTRLRPLTDTTPKAMLPLDGAPLIDHTLHWLRWHGITDVAINLHHLPHAITGYVGDGSRWGLRVWYSHEPELLGTAGALLPMADWLTEDRKPFVVAYGDKYMQADLTALVEFHRRKAALVTIAVHETDRPRGAGLVKMEGGGRIVKYIEKPDEPFSKWANAGLYVCDWEIVPRLPGWTPCDWGKDVFERIVQSRYRQGMFYAHPLPGLAMDIGTPARYELAQRLAEQPGAIFVDRDGTINEMVPQEHVTTREQFRFIPGALDALAILAQKSEAPIVIWTNQPAIGRGEATQEQVDDLHDWMVEQIVAAGGRVDAVYVCPHAHGTGCDCRKPAPGMLLRAARCVNLAKSVVVGDTRFDLQAAWAVGVRHCYLVQTGWPLKSYPEQTGGHRYTVTTSLLKAAHKMVEAQLV